MSKRFTDTEKWKKSFLKSLPSEWKLFWLYLCDDCNNAGVWEIDFEVASLRLGTKYTLDEAMDVLGTKIVLFDNNEKLFIPSFIDFQYGILKHDNRAHKSALDIIERYNLRGYLSPLQGAKDKDKDKDKDMDKDMDMDKNKDNDFNFNFDFVILEAQIAGLSKSQAESMYHHYNSQGWYKSNGQPVTDIKSTAINWLNKESNNRGKETLNQQQEETYEQREQRIKRDARAIEKMFS